MTARWAGPKLADQFPWTDLGNAERLAARHCGDLRFVDPDGWHYWDAMRWIFDRDGEVQRRAQETVRAMYPCAARIEDDQRRRDWSKFVRASESEPRLRAMVSLAETDSTLRVRSERFDDSPWLLNVANGTIDLRTGRRRAHRRGDLLTKLAPAVRDPRARSSLWEQFLRTVTGGDAQLEAFLRRAVGYTLTGLTDEEVFFFLHGPGASGKTTFLEAVKAALGDYAATASFETFLQRASDAAIRNDIARLAGVRMVIATEVDEGQRLAAGLIKSITGGDTVTARFLYREYFQFRPQLKLWLAGNERPSISAFDHALWRRVLVVPFLYPIPAAQRDKTLKRQLQEPEAQAAILTWALRGCREVQRGGLRPPEAVTQFTGAYRAENDPVGRWISEECSLRPESMTAAGRLWADYEQWSTETGEEPVSRKAWARALVEHGCRRRRTGQERLWVGIALKDQRRVLG